MKKKWQGREASIERGAGEKRAIRKGRGTRKEIGARKRAYDQEKELGKGRLARKGKMD